MSRVDDHNKGGFPVPSLFLGFSVRLQVSSLLGMLNLAAFIQLVDGLLRFLSSLIAEYTRTAISKKRYRYGKKNLARGRKAHNDSVISSAFEAQWTSSP